MAFIRRNTFERLSVDRETKLEDLKSCIRFGLNPIGFSVQTNGGHYGFDKYDYFNYFKATSIKFDIEVTNIATNQASHKN